MTPEDFRRFKEVFRFVLESERPFYREKYGRDGFAPSTVTSPDKFTLIPPLTRDELTAANPWQRLFFSLEETLICGYTSGTTSRELLPIWRSYYLADPPDIDATKILILYPQSWRALGQCEWFRRRGIFPVCGDVHNLPVAAEISRVLEVDSIYSTPTIALMVAEHLHRLNVTTSIRSLMLGGERVSAVRREALAHAYPHAFVRTHYTCSEVGPAGNFCPGSVDLTLYHQDPHFYYEVIDREMGNALLEQREGELLLTTLEKVPTPLIRYRTGDMGALSESCLCDEQLPAFTVLGRVGYEITKVGGFELHADAFERGVAVSEDAVRSDTLDATVTEEVVEDVIKLRLHFQLVQRRILDAVERREVIESIRRHTRVGRELSLFQAEEEGYFLETQFTFLDPQEEHMGKSRISIRRL